MPSVRKINNKFNKIFGEKIEAHSESGRIVLSGELDRWSEVVTAGLIAVRAEPSANIVNAIECIGSKPLRTRKPRIEDSELEGEDPDVLIIGGGVVGCAVARELSRYRLKILLIEKEGDVAVHASGHNTGLVHSGAGLRRGSMKHYFTLLGNKRMETVCKELDVPYRRSGQYYLYSNPFWFPFMMFSRIYWRLRGVKGGRVAGSYDLGSAEPGITGAVKSSLFFPSGGVTDPHALTIAYAENAAANGVSFFFNTMAQEMEVEDGVITSVTTNRGTVMPKIVINAAGVFCENIAAMAGDHFFSVRPLKGTNIVIDRRYADNLVRSAVSLYGKSDKLRRKVGKRRTDNLFSMVKSVHGTVLAGPFFQDSINKEDFSTEAKCVDAAVKQAGRISSNLDSEQIIRTYAGVCASTYNDDFIVETGKYVSNIIHAAGISYPGLTASPAIAENIAEQAVAKLGRDQTIYKNPSFNPKREAAPVLRDMDLAAREALIREYPDYGIPVCHCEQVSRGEITDALNRDIRSDSIDGVKHRTRAGCGVCQGQFCIHNVHSIISEEKNAPLHHVRKSSGRSELVFGDWAHLLSNQYDAITHAKHSHEDEIFHL